jgi:serine/threonine protein kinase
MPPDKEASLNRILESVVGLDAGARTIAVEAACGEDLELREEVMRLLRLGDEMDVKFLEGQENADTSSPKLWRLNRYEIQELIGRGGMSSVFRALDTEIGRHVAVKLLTMPGGETDSRKYFIGEVRALGSISHRHIVQIYDCGEFAGIPYLVMELLKGQDLLCAIRKNECGSIQNKCRIVRQIAVALEHIHGLNILHRDIKPSNVFLEPDGNIKLMDFGISRRETVDLTRSHTFAGTLQYMAPEQLQGSPSTAQSDIYAWGILFYEVLVGRDFSPLASVAEICRRALEEPLPVRPLEEAGVPPAVIRLIRDATAKDPRRRLLSAADVLDRLDKASPQELSTSPARWIDSGSRVNWGLRVAFGLFAVVSLALLTNAFLRSGHPIQHNSTATGFRSAPALSVEQQLPVQLPSGPRTNESQAAGRAPVQTRSQPKNLPFIVTAPVPSEIVGAQDETRQAPANSGSLPVTQPRQTTTPPPESSITPEDRDWQKLRTAPELTALRTFIDAYPSGKYTAQARQIAARIECDNLRSNPFKLESLVQFAETYPEHPFAATARSIAHQIKLRADAANRIGETLARYADAFSGKRIDDLAAYRELTRDQRKKIADQFRDARKIELTLVPVQAPEFAEPIEESTSAANQEPSHAVVQASQHLRIVAGDGTVLPGDKVLTIHMRRTGEGWVISSL